MSVLVKPSDFDEVERVSERVLQNSYAPFQHHFIEFLAAHLSDSARLFNGDLEEMLVCVVLARANLRDEVGQSRLKKSGASERSALSAARLSELTGIPRETVRRKLKSLENRGWVSRKGRSGWRLALQGETPVLRADLQDYLQREIRRLVKLVLNLQEFI